MSGHVCRDESNRKDTSMSCTICGNDISAARGGNAKTCSSECSLQHKRTTQRERRKRYQGTCVDCGGPTDGSNGYGGQPKRCLRCTATAKRKWTREAIISSLLDFSVRYGRRPSAMDMLVHHAGEGWPCFSTVQREFGSWNKAVAAAGWEPIARGQRIGEPTPDRVA